MENISEYVNMFMAAPLATILLLYMFFDKRSNQSFITGIIKIQTETIKEQHILLNEAIKIIKQISRNIKD